jgi:sugar lactone lactonase YvrE
LRAFRVLFASLVVGAVLLALFVKTRYGGPTRPFRDVSTPPVLPASAVETVATLEEAPGNVAVSADGRVFFNFHPEARPAIAVAELVAGTPVAYPSADFPLFDFVFSVRIDRQGRLWTLGTGFHGLRHPRLLAFDLATRALVHRWDLPRDVAPPGSYVQDFQVSPDGKTVYLADTAALSRNPALIVYETGTGIGRRVLERDASVTARPYLIDAKGSKMLLLGGLYAMHPDVDSIALDEDGTWLYFGPMSHETLFRVRTSDLRDSSLSAATLSAKVEAYGPKPQSDGASIDRKGNVYLTDVEHGAIARLSPDRTLVTLVRDPRWRWGDGLSFGPEDWLYVTDSAIPDILMRTPGHVKKSAPFFIWRFRAGVPGTPGH